MFEWLWKSHPFMSNFMLEINCLWNIQVFCMYWQVMQPIYEFINAWYTVINIEYVRECSKKMMIVLNIHDWTWNHFEKRLRFQFLDGWKFINNFWQTDHIVLTISYGIFDTIDRWINEVLAFFSHHFVTSVIPRKIHK